MNTRLHGLLSRSGILGRSGRVVALWVFVVIIMPALTAAVYASGCLLILQYFYNVLYELFVLLGWIAPCVTLLAGLALVFPGIQRTAGRIFGSAAWLCIALLVSHMWCDQIKQEAFAGVVGRSASLIAAIHEFEKDTGGPPADLQALVPKYLACVPRTGLHIFPEYFYEVNSDDKTKRWSLIVGHRNFDFGDRLSYRPAGGYEYQYGLGRWLHGDTRIGDWAYER